MMETNIVVLAQFLSMQDPFNFNAVHNELGHHCTMVDGTTIARGIEVTVDGSR